MHADTYSESSQKSITFLSSLPDWYLSKHLETNLIHFDRLNLDCSLQENVIPCLEFSIELQSNKLIYQKDYTKRQQIIYVLI